MTPQTITGWAIAYKGGHHFDGECTHLETILFERNHAERHIEANHDFYKGRARPVRVTITIEGDG